MSRWNRRGPAYIPIYPPAAPWPGSYRRPRDPLRPPSPRGPSFTLLFSSLFRRSSFLRCCARFLRPLCGSLHSANRGLSVCSTGAGLAILTFFPLPHLGPRTIYRCVSVDSSLQRPTSSTGRSKTNPGQQFSREIFKYRIGSVSCSVDPRRRMSLGKKFVPSSMVLCDLLRVDFVFSFAVIFTGGLLSRRIFRPIVLPVNDTMGGWKDVGRL